MSLFKKKQDDNKGNDALKKLLDIMNNDGFELHLFKCPNGCVDAIIADRTDAPVEAMNKVPVCPKCGSRAVPA